MASHNYNTRNNTAPEIVNSNTSPCTETSELINKLETKLLSRFDDLNSEIHNVKDVIIKRLQDENERLRNKVCSLEKKVISLESDHNSLEQYGRRNNIEVSGIPDNVRQNDLEDKVIEVVSAINVEISKEDIEACHRIGKSHNNLKKKTIVRFTNRKVAKSALYKRKHLQSMDKSSIGLQNAEIFINENLTAANNKIAFNCRK